MKKIILLSLMLTVVFTVKSNAANLPAPHILIDTPRAKFKRPTGAIADAKVTDILNQMRQKRNDAEKIAVLKAGIKDEGITVKQLTTLLNQFLADASKLECAEYAYANITNYKAFLDLQDLFADEKNKIALEDYVRKYK